MRSRCNSVLTGEAYALASMTVEVQRVAVVPDADTGVGDAEVAGVQRLYEDRRRTTDGILSEPTATRTVSCGSSPDDEPETEHDEGSHDGRDWHEPLRPPLLGRGVDSVGGSVGGACHACGAGVCAASKAGSCSECVARISTISTETASSDAISRLSNVQRCFSVCGSGTASACW